jgi:hypothetical protein
VNWCRSMSSACSMTSRVRSPCTTGQRRRGDSSFPAAYYRHVSTTHSRGAWRVFLFQNSSAILNSYFFVLNFLLIFYDTR